jgi:hypothetical protein
MAGNGRLSLLTAPASIERRILGNPAIEMPDDTGAKPAPPPPPPEASNPPEQPSNPPAPPPTPPAPPQAAGGPVKIRINESRDLGHIDQDQLDLMVTGHGAVRAEGRVDTLTVRLAGSGNVNLGELSARSVTVRLTGSGNVIVAPSEDAHVSIMGSGNVRLTTRPEHIERHVMGSGHIVEAH